MKKAIDIMNEDLIYTSKNTSFEDIIKIMKEKKIGRIPVVEAGEVYGVVTRDDILVKKEKAPLPPVIAFWDVLISMPNNKNFEDKVKKLSGYTAEEIMDKNFLKVKTDDDLEEIVTKMHEKNYSYALVFESQKLCGIITKTDLINKSF